MDVFWKAAVVWLGISVLAVVNGILREGLLKKVQGERVAHVTSTVLLSAIVLMVSFFSVRWIGIGDFGTAWAVGAGWLVATLSFEFLAGHYLFGNSWEKIFGDYRVHSGRVWLLVPICTLFGPAFAFGGFDPKWAVPYSIGNFIAIGLLYFSILKPQVARWGIVILFLYAGVYNCWLGLTHPGDYQAFAEMVIVPWYREFITGFFREHQTVLIVGIAIGQLVSAFCLAFGGRLLWLGVFGVCLFLLGIAPFGVGSAFPFSLFVSCATVIVAASVGSKR